MKVVILCGGRGIRLAQDVEFRPKPMTPIGQVPILCHLMKLYIHHGYTEFILCLGSKGDTVKDFFLRFREYAYSFTLDMRNGTTMYHKKTDWDDLTNAKITFLDTGIGATTGERIAQVEPYIGDDEHFLLTYGDTLSDVHLGNLLTFHQAMGRIVTVTAAHPTTRLGIIEHADGLAASFRESDPHRSAVKGGFYVCSHRIFDYIRQHQRCVFEGDVLPKLVQEHELAVFEHPGFWHLLESYKDLAQLEAMWNNGTAPWWIK